MRTIYDRLAKDLIEVLLRPVSRAIVRELEVTAEPQRLDLFCEPDPDRVNELDGHDLLSRIVAEGPCAFEFFHQPPSLEEVTRSLRKVLALRHSAQPSRDATLWIVSSGRPSRVFVKLPSFKPLAGWPAGVYAMDPGLRVRVIVIGDLPRSRSTLLFRLLGAGRTLGEALQELDGLPREDPLFGAASAVMIEWLLDRDAADTQRFKELLMLERYEKWRKETLEIGKAEGKAEGRAEGEAEGKREAVIAVLRARSISVDGVTVERIRRCSDVAELDRWLVRAVTAKRATDIFE